MQGRGRRACSALAVSVAALAALASVSVGTTGAQAAATAPHTASARSAATTDTWSFIRYSCRTVTAGQVCLAFEGNGKPSTYRAVYVLKPNAGQWIRPAYWAETYVGSDYFGTGGIASSGYRRFCAAECPAAKSTSTIVRPTSIFSVQTFVFQTPQGSYDLSAGTTTVTGEADAYCYGRTVSVSNQLTTTSDGTVYLARWFNVIVGRPIVARLLDNSSTVFTKLWTKGTGQVSYESPHYYTGWTRQRTSSTNSGAWHVQESRAYLFYYDDRGQVVKTYTGPPTSGTC